MYMRKIWFLPLLLAVSIESTPSPQPPYDYQSTTRSVPAVVPQVVYTADRIRDSPQRDRLRDSELFPSTATTGTARTTHGAEGESEEPENAGFVEPIDFTSLLSGVNTYNDKQNLEAGNSNPFTAESKDSFAGFFGNNKDIFVEPNFGSLSASSSNQNSQKQNADEDDVGFVDPNVQFRSLFDSSATATGFKPQDFLNYKDDSTGVDPSKGSQTRAYPSFTYSGRQSDESYDSPSADPKYRSSYRQVGSQDRTYDDNNGRRSNGPYEDRGSYDGDRDRPQSPPTPRYNPPPPRGQETAHAPKASANTPKKSDSPKDPKCKKVEKQVDYSDDYAAYTDPEPDYDPASYSSRYKRQARGGGRGGSKRPMTCYVCEDEDGRYAERCSYDSKADPSNKKGNYYSSSSTSYNDQGRRPSGGRERHRRNPPVAAASSPSATTTATVSSTPTTQDPLSGPLEEPKRLEKRQSGNNRYPPSIGNNNNNRDNNRGRNDDDFGGGREFGGNSPGAAGGGRESGAGNRNEGFDDDFGAEDYGGGQRAGSERQGVNRNNEGREDDFGGPDFGNAPRGRSNNNNNNNDESVLAREFGADAPQGTRRQDDNYGFVEPRQGSQGVGRNTEFDFGPPRDFGRETSASNTNNQGFNFDFSIPREFDPDIQLRTANSNPSPNLHSSASNNNNFAGFDSGYDDYIKQYFPEAFGSSTPSSSPSSSSFRPSHGPPSHSPSSSSHRDRSVPDKEHTQQSPHFIPPPYIPGGGNGEHLEKLVGAFSSRDRNGCEKVQKGDMTCYVCRDPRGMQKEECMYASNDPKNKKMAYHEVTEYSSLPPASILPLPRPELAVAASSTHFTSTSPSPASSSLSQPSLSPAPSTSSTRTHHITKESRTIETKIKKSPLDYDFDY